MDYEKKYKETIAWIDIIMPTLTKEQQEDALENFPELAESEDERIRKDIMVLVKDWWDRVNKDNISTKEQMLAWLERQGNVDTVSYEVAENEKREFVGYGFLKCKGDFLSFKEGENYWLEYVGKDNYNVRSDNLLGQTFHITPQQLYTVFRPTTWLEKQGDNNNQNWKPSKGQINALEHFVRSIGESGYASPYDDNTNLLNSLINDLYKLEKQGEQKSFENVKPKFHEGDWIVFNGLTLCVKEVVKGFYRTISIGGVANSYNWDIDNVARLWTIQDTKKGDVLEFEDHERVVVGIVSFVNERTGKVDVSCLLEDNEFKIGTFFALDTIKPHPATKEQCDILMKEMADAGYTFDFEKKKLKKVGQKLTELAKGEDYGKCWKPTIDVDAMVEEYVKQYAYIDMKSCDSIRKVYREGILNTLDKINK